MKNYKIWLAFLIGLACSNSFSQSTVANNTGNGTNFLGFGTGNFPLSIRNTANPLINITSAGFNKFAITRQNVWNGLNGLSWTNVQRTTMGLRGETTLAWSMLHLLDNGAGTLPVNLQRDWMNVGVSMTSNLDFMYSGLLERPITGGNNLQTDAVIAWGCQDQASLADNFRLLFISPGVGSAPSASIQGLEIMRASPIGNVGIGDFSTMPNGIGSSYGAPRARLDVQFRGLLPGSTDNTGLNVFNDVAQNGSTAFKRAIHAEVQNTIGKQC